MCKWYEETYRLVQEEKWTQIKSKGLLCGLECETCCDSFHVEHMFIELNRFSPDAQAVARMLKAATPSWELAVSFQLPRVGTLQSMVEAGVIDVNSSIIDISLAGYYIIYRPAWWREALDYIFAQGCSVDLQDSYGRSHVLTLLCFRPTSRDILEFLLERGADLLLQDNSGTSAASYIRESPDFTEAEKERYLRLA